MTELTSDLDTLERHIKFLLDLYFSDEDKLIKLYKTEFELKLLLTISSLSISVSLYLIQKDYVLAFLLIINFISFTLYFYPYVKKNNIQITKIENRKQETWNYLFDFRNSLTKLETFDKVRLDSLINCTALLD